ncbi:MAG: FkbM family methyltransferase [Verrucomicrobia bacterium]|nr:FkbM family methyltransferase [Verrucomicrobiota bacterium]
MFESLKNAIRTAEAHLTPRTSEVAFQGRTLRFRRSLWWVNETQAGFDEEIRPYFEAVEAKRFHHIVDAGAATGMFTVAAALLWPGSRIYGFEPSTRQRVLLQRNLKLNGIEPGRVSVEPFGLWDREESLAFRTIGAMSAFMAVSELSGQLSFGESVPVVPLDSWRQRVGAGRVDLIKMDIEGAEIEALKGAQETLEKDRPELLIMAYHLRDGGRTYEKCARFLETLDYIAREMPGTSGFLHGVPA